MKLSLEEELAFQKADTCYLCGKPTGEDKVRDHEHAFNGNIVDVLILLAIFSFGLEETRLSPTFTYPFYFTIFEAMTDI